MNGIDLLIVGLFFISILIGAVRGFTKELLSLFSWGGATSLSYLFLPVTQRFMHDYIANPVMAGVAGSFCSFIVLLVILSLIANLIAGYIHESSFRGIDHSLGFGFGIVRGVFFISAVELFISTFWPRQVQSPAIQNARFVPMARKGGDVLLQVLPTDARTWILDQAAKVENQVNSSKLRDRLKTDIPDLMKEGVLQGNGNDSAAKYGGEMAIPSELSTAAAPHLMQEAPQILSQGYQQNPPRVIIQSQQGDPIQSQMLVIHPPQRGQAPQLAPASSTLPGGYAPEGTQPSPSPAGLAKSATPQDKQSTVDALSRLKPRSSKENEESGYTQGQRNDMRRLLQMADGG